MRTSRRAFRPALARTSRVPHAPVFNRYHTRDRDAALPAPARRQGPRARPLDDPARLVHDEAQRDDRDDPGHVARVRRAASVRARAIRRSGYGSSIDRARADAVRGHRLRRRLAAAQRRLAGRVRGPAGDPRVPREPRRGASQRLPDSRRPRTAPIRRPRRWRACRSSSSRATRRQRRSRRSRGEGARSTATTSRRSWSPTRRRTACSSRASSASARSSTRTAARSTSTART